MTWIVLLCIIGLSLVLAEVFIPGFGIFGILGSICLIGAVICIAKLYGVVAGVCSIVVLGILFACMILFMRKSGLYNRVVLKEQQEEKSFDETTLQGLVGATGITQTTLRPYGVAEFDGKRVDVCSVGDFIDREQTVHVVKIEGKTVFVEAVSV